MSNHPNRARAANARAADKLIAAAERLVGAAENAAHIAARRGVVSDAADAKLAKARADFDLARDALRARFAEPVQ